MEMKDDVYNRREHDSDIVSSVAQRAVHHSPAPTFVLATDGTIHYANPAALAVFHYDYAALVQTTFVELLDEGSRAKARTMLASAQPHYSPTYELNQLTSDQDVLTLRYRAISLDDIDHEIGAVLLVGELMTSVTVTTSRLIELNRRLNALFELAASTSRSLVMHELLDRALDVAVGELNLRAAAVFMREDVPAELLVDQQTYRLALTSYQGFTSSFVQKATSDQHMQPFYDPAFCPESTWVKEGSLEELGLVCHRYQPYGRAASLTSGCTVAK